MFDRLYKILKLTINAYFFIQPNIPFISLKKQNQKPFNMI